MARFGLLIGSFLITFSLLISVAMFSFGWSPFAPATAPPTAEPTAVTIVEPTPEPVATPLPTSESTATTEPVPTDTQAPTATPIPLPTPSWSPAPLRTPPPSLTPGESTVPGATQTFVVNGIAFSSSDVPANGQLVQSGDGVILQTTDDSADALWVTYVLDPANLPPGSVINNVDVRICGEGDGDFWEVYGPPGSEPDEYEVLPPEADGCWHFTGAPGDDLSVIAGTMLESRLYVERVEFTITFAQ
jgi:hypothetical protein